MKKLVSLIGITIHSDEDVCQLAEFLVFGLAECSSFEHDFRDFYIDVERVEACAN